MVSKTFESLDIVRFAVPDVRNLDVGRTAVSLRERLGGTGFMSYDPLWRRVSAVAARSVTDAEIEGWWKSSTLIEAMKVLRDQYADIGRWYHFPQTVRDVLGLSFKSSIRGISFSKTYGAEAHIINPRKGQVLTSDDLAFLARAAYEEHCIDDPNDPQPVVFDLSSRNGSKVRHPTIYRGLTPKMISVEEFESIIEKFFDAAVLAGYQLPEYPGEFTADLFRRPPD
jgi:hypothetical protein